MPNFFLPNQAVDYLTLRHINFAGPTPTTYTYGLYTVNRAPLIGDTYGTDYNGVGSTASEFPALYGYTRLDVTTGTWVGGTTAGLSTYAAPTLVWTFAANPGTYTIYGVFGIGRNDGWTIFLIGAQLLVTPYPLLAPGGVFAFTPTWSEESQ
jgi:hypothetical protein